MKKISGDKVRWGVIGVGDVCEVKSAPAMQVIKDSTLVAVMRRNGPKARDYAQRHQVAKWYDDAKKLINDPEVNALYIATPPVNHADYTIQAAKKGKPVYVEKPMARSTAECRNMINACTKANIPLYVAYYRRRLPNFEKFKSLLEQGAVGKVQSLKIELIQPADPGVVSKAKSDQSNWRVNPKVAGGGYFYDLASHQFDYLDYVLGPIESVSGYAENRAGFYPAADNVQAVFRFRDGILGNGHWCFTADCAKDEMTVFGSEGKLSMSFFGDPTIYLERDGQPIKQYTFELPRHIQQPLIQTVVDDLLGRGECPSTGTSAIRTNSIMEQITQHYYQQL